MLAWGFAWEHVMKAMLLSSRAIAIGLGLLFVPNAAAACDIKVMSSAGISEAYRSLIPEFERTTGHKIDTIRGPSMGDRPEAVPNRIARGEAVDVVIVNTEALDRLIADGKVVAASRVELKRAPIGRAGGRAERHGLPMGTALLTISRALVCTKSGERKAHARPEPYAC